MSGRPLICECLAYCGMWNTENIDEHHYIAFGEGNRICDK
jgi:hypothetical protein